VNIESPIYSEKELKNILNRYLTIQKIWLKRYKLEFETRRQIFDYIKKSGVSGGKRLLSFSQVKKLLHNYPKNYLEFEVLFVVANSKNLFSKS